MHIRTGEIAAGADFLWPPHIMIYSSFLLSFLVALIAIGVVALPGWRAGERDPRKLARANSRCGGGVGSEFAKLAVQPVADPIATAGSDGSDGPIGATAPRRVPKAEQHGDKLLARNTSPC